MKKKVDYFDRQLVKEYLSVVSIISLVLSLILIFIQISQQYKMKLGMIFGCALVVIYICMWIRANKQDHIILDINRSQLEIKIGDIFQQEPGDLKVIGCNEYFDTQVDNKIIAENSIHGKFIKQYLNDIGSIEDLNEKMQRDTHLNEYQDSINELRKEGKKIRYRLGSIFEYQGYLLTAFTRFDNNNRAYLTIKDYLDCLINFWNEVDIISNSRTVVIPLMGSGITRIKEYDLSEQELLELLIWTFKVSRVKFAYPAKIIIVIHEGKKDKINFYKLRSVGNGL